MDDAFTFLLAAEPITWSSIALNAVFILVLVILSGLFSGSEAVLFSLTPSQIEKSKTSTNPFRRWAAGCMDQPGRTLMNILVANTAVNVMLFSSSYVLFNELAANYGKWVSPLSAVFSVLLVVMFGEVVPKIIGMSLADNLTPVSGVLVRTVGWPLGWIGRLLDVLVVEPINRVFFADMGDTGESLQDLTSEELKTLVEMNRQSGLLHPDEDMILREVVDLNDVSVRDIMIPRVEVKSFDINAPRETLIELMRETKLKKIPIYDGSIDDIMGVIYAKVLFFSPDRPLRELVTPVRFIPELITCEQALQHFRQTHSQLAIAVDEFGGFEGLVTLEDVLEEIVGDIHDPEDELEQPELVKVGKRDYEMSGQLNVQFWSDSFGLPRFSERVATVGGLVTARLGRTPKVGDSVKIGNIVLRVLEIKHRRIDRLAMHVVSESGESDG